MNNQENYIKVSIENKQEPEKAQAVRTCKEQPFLQVVHNQPKLSSLNKNTTLSMVDVRNLAVLKFGGVNAFGRALGVTRGMASRLLSGEYVPLKPETIHRISNCLGIDPVTLSQIYSNIKKEGVKNGTS